MRASIYFVTRDARDEELPVTICVNEQNNEITLVVESRGEKKETILPYEAWRDIVHVVRKMGLDRWE